MVIVDRTGSHQVVAGPAEVVGRGRSVDDLLGAPDDLGDLDDAARLESLARPLLALVRRITGLETSFVTLIDWVAQKQLIVFALDCSELEVPEGMSVDWQDATCRWTFLTGKTHTSDVPKDFPGSIAAEQMGMRSYLAVPILDGPSVVGTVCGASRAVIELGSDQLEMVQLVAEALSAQVKSDAAARVRRDCVEREITGARDDLSVLAAAARRMEELALTDPLTGLVNRRGFTARWEQELASSGRHDHPISLLLADIDMFKQVNDRHGHAGGDLVLQAMASVLTAASRSHDSAARIGGDEFALIVTDTVEERAVGVAQRMRGAFAKATEALGIPCTVSVGVSGSDRIPRRDLMATADKALYRSKRLGRDRVETWLEASEGPT